MAYWQEKGIRKGGKVTQPNKYKWCKTTVTKILTQQEYCGDIINFKTYSKSYKNTYRVCTTQDGWLPAVKNLEDYAGIENHPITGVAIKVDKGSVWYQAHVKGGGWLGKITGYDINDIEKGYAGNGKEIDALRVYYTTPNDLRNAGKIYCAKYKVSPTNTSAYYDWQIDTDTNNGQDGYAGDFGVSIDKLYIYLN